MKTPKGTELPILNLRGKEYLEIKFRIVWFREEKPTWSIETEYLSITDKSAMAKATIKDETGRVMATSHKSETVSDFRDFIEKCETSAIGRALALIGYGTQFCADELDEGERIVDSPITRRPPTNPTIPMPQPGSMLTPQEKFPATAGQGGGVCQYCKTPKILSKKGSWYCSPCYKKKLEDKKIDDIPPF